MLKTNKRAIDSNAVSKVFNGKKWTGQSLSKMKTPANIVKREYLFVCVRHVILFISVMCGWVWPSFGWVWLSVSECDLFLAGCGWVWPFFWLGVGGCGWVWPFLGLVWVGVGKCDLFLAGCGWVWVSTWLITAHFDKHKLLTISSFMWQLTYDNFRHKSAKLLALRAKNALPCQRVLRAHVPTWLACSRAHVPMCLACLRAHVPTCLACLRTNVLCVLTCLACLCAHVPCVFTCSHVNVPCVLTCSCVNLPSSIT